MYHLPLKKGTKRGTKLLHMLASSVMSEENSVLSVDKYWLDMQMSLCLENLMSLVQYGTA